MSSCRYSSDANYDLEEIAVYLSNLNPVAASRFLDALEETCELLAGHPKLGRLRPELADGLRSFPIGNYLVFYTVASDGIDVVRIIYGGRNLPAIFKQ
jgi:toxin ParE1/3/4